GIARSMAGRFRFRAHEAGQAQEELTDCARRPPGLAVHKRKRPAMDRAIPLSSGGAVGPTACARESGVRGACRRPPRPTRLPAGTSRVLSFTGRLGALAAWIGYPALRPGPTLEAA